MNGLPKRYLTFSFAKANKWPRAGVRTGVLAALPPDRSNSERLCRRPEQFKCQALLSEKSILAAMTYVDLNPLRANIAVGINTSDYTSVKARHLEILRDQSKASHCCRVSGNQLSLRLCSDFSEVSLTSHVRRASLRGLMPQCRAFAQWAYTRHP